MKTRRSRRQATRKYNKVYYIIPEGRISEPAYFSIIRGLVPDGAGIALSCKSMRESSIPAVIRLAQKVSASNPHPNDEVWCVLDHDAESHTQAQFANLGKWEGKSPRHHVAISIPRFEYWLLAHFEDAPKARDALSDSYLATYLPGYDRTKELAAHRNLLTRERVLHAINVARAAETHRNSSVGSGLWRLAAALLGGSA